jgi:dual specificity phosphatase 12
MSEIIPNLWVGNLDLTYDLEFLRSAHITHIVTVLEREHGTHAMAALRVEQLSFRLADYDDAPIYDTFLPVCEFIDAALLGGGAVYVHCLMGISRSPTIVAAYLIWKRGVGLEEALRILRAARPIIEPNNGFLSALLKWQNLEDP